MTCHYCRSVNADDDHRCRRCGRRLTGSAVEAPPEHAQRAIQAIGANALAAATAEMPHPATASEPRPKSTIQSSLFLEELAPKIIPFDRGQKRQDTQQLNPDLPETAELFPPRGDVESAGKPRPAVRKPAPESTQAKLDFLPPSPHSPRVLKTTVEATIYCDSPVASPIHRATAAALDAAVIGFSFVIFFGIFRVFGGPVSWTKQSVPIFIGAFVLIALLYGFFWMIAETETAGMRWTDLKLVSFNGFPPDRKTRALRLMGCFLSFCSGMIGIFWALVDEEGLTWHDHMSKTFPTLRDTGSRLIRQ